MSKLFSSLSGATIVSLAIGGIALGVGSVLAVKTATVVVGIGIVGYGIAMTTQGVISAGQDYRDGIQNTMAYMRF